MVKPLNEQPPVDLKQPPSERGSFLWAMMESIADSQGSMQNSQVIGAVTVELCSNIQAAIYAHYNNSPNDPGTLAYDVAKLEAAAARGDTNGPDGTTYWTSKFNADNATASGCEGTQQGVLEQQQGAVSSTSQELGVIVQSGQSLTSYMATGSNFLGNPIS